MLVAINFFFSLLLWTSNSHSWYHSYSMSLRCSPANFLINQSGSSGAISNGISTSVFIQFFFMPFTSSTSMKSSLIFLSFSFSIKTFSFVFSLPFFGITFVTGLLIAPLFFTLITGVFVFSDLLFPPKNVNRRPPTRTRPMTISAPLVPPPPLFVANDY